MSLNPFDWIDAGLDAAGEAWDFVADSYTNLLKSAGQNLWASPGAKIATETVKEVTDPAYRGIKVGSRAVTTVFDFPLQVLNNTAAFSYNSPIIRSAIPGIPMVGRGKGFKKAEASTLEQAVGIIRNTTLADIIADSLPGGQKVDVGSGFFVGGATRAEVDDNKKELYPTIYGSSFTPGRAFAGALADNGVIEPGDVGYNTISGAIDFGWTVAADPVNWIPAGAVARIGGKAIPLTAAARAGKRAKVTTTLSPQAKKIIEEAADAGQIILNQAGLIDNGRRTVNPNNWEAFKLTDKGQKWIDGFVGDNANDAAVIWRGSNGQIPPGTAAKLADAKTADEVIEILDDAVYGPDPLSHIRIMPGIDPRPIVTKVGATIKGNMSRYRPFADTLPESTDFPLNNPLKAVKNADSVMAVLKVDNDTRNSLLNDLFRVFNGTDDTAIFDWLNKFEETVVRSQLEKWNYTEDEIRRISGWRQRYEETVSSFATDSAGSSVPLEWMVGGPNGGYGPLLISQILKVNPVLIDPVDLRTIADRLGPVRSRLEKSRRRITEQTVDPVSGRIIVEETEPNKLVNTPLAMTEAVGDLVDSFQARAWKPNILMRPRYLVRVLPEEMLRVSASGIFDHAGQYLLQIATNRNARDAFGRVIITARRAAKIEAEINEAGRMLTRYQNLQQAGQTTYRGRGIQNLIDRTQKEIDVLTKNLDDFDNRVAELMPGVDDALLRGMPNKTADLLLNPSAVSGMLKSGTLMSVERSVNPNLWSKAMAQRLAERAANGYYRSIAEALFRGDTVDQITARFNSGDLKQFLDEYRQSVGNLDPNYVWNYDGVRNFVKKNIDDIDLYTRNRDPELMKALITNEFGGQTLSSAKGFRALPRPGQRQVAGYEPNSALRKYYKDNYAQDPTSPTRVNYFPSILDADEATKTARERITARYDAILSMFWDGVYGASSDLLSRQPLWEQSKWQRIIELIPVMARSEAEELAKTVRNLNLPRTIKEDVIEFAKTANGEMSRSDVNLLAELFASRNTKESLFDASRRTVFGATHRKLFPFFDAFVELTGSALKLATNPKILHRADKVIGELQSNTFLGSDIDGDGKKDGFLYQDPVSGEEMYAVPVDGLLGKQWRKLGLDFRFGNTLDSLSMITTPYPGLSPFVALPVVKSLPDTPEFDKLRDLIAPYGIPDISDPSILQYILPGASEQMQRILGSAGVELFGKVENRERAVQAVIRAMQVAATVKDYDPVTPGQQGPTGYKSIQEWQADGKELGVKIWGLTGWAGLFMPGAPIAQWTAKTRKGNVLIGVLSQRWNQIDAEGDKLGLKYQDKLEQFVDEFGAENLVAFLQPITDRSIVGSNSSREYYDWYRTNKATVDKYPDVGGYFSPSSGELDPDVWNIQRIAGEVGYKDPDEFAKNVESAVANFIFNRNLREFEETIPASERGTKAAERALRDEKNRLADGLKKAYPNWDRAGAATANKNRRDLQITQIREFINEPTQQDNPVVIAAKDYLDFRDQNVQYILDNTTKVTEKNWTTLSKNRAAIALRETLWNHGETLAEKYPAFVNLWQNVLSREFVSVETED